MKGLIIFNILLIGGFARGEIRINEVMASNVRSFPNAMDFEDYPDWVEIFNSSSVSQSLFGYYLSDDPDNLRKWPFPGSSRIEAGEQLVIVADGYDRARGSVESRNYPGGLSFTTQFDHTNFKLSSAGEEVSLSRETHDNVALVSSGSSWNYLSSEASVPENWNSEIFDDSSWESAVGGFGYDAPFYRDLATEVGYGGSKDDKHVTTYFRQKFTITADQAFFRLNFFIDVNDGVVVYLNGEEIRRSNLPAGPLNSETLAIEELGPFAAVNRVTIQISPDKLLEGENIMAVEVHQASPLSDDLVFDPEVFGLQFGVADFLEGEWRYLDDGSSLPATWTGPGFNDTAWEKGKSGLGYFARETLLDPEITQIPFGGNAGAKPLNTYFRTQFIVDDLSDARGLRLTYQIDDGAIFYLNGVEILQENMNPTIELSEVGNESASAPYQTVILPADFLKIGRNTLAVNVVQASPTSPSMRFDASLGVLVAGNLEVVDRISFADQVDDISLGRNGVDPESWVFFETPTPGAVNGGRVVTDPRMTGPSVEVFPKGGLYEGREMVTMMTSSGEIRYTTDGSNPKPDSLRYDGPFEVAVTTVIRARAFDSGKVPGEIVTRTYFVGETFASGLPVVSLTAPPETLFGAEIGIYGFIDAPRGNIHKGVDAPGNLEFFPIDGSEGFSANGGIRLGGENNFLSHAQKAFNFLTRGKYGDDAVNYDVFPGSGLGTFTGLTLREGGDDWGKAHLTDAIWDPLVKGEMEAETSRYRPVSLFVNGAYWGLYNLRDRWDENWFYQEYGTDNGDYDHVGVSLSGFFGAEHGDAADWRELIAYISGAPFDDPEVLEILQSKVDFDSMIDFMICETYGRNSSWRGNREWWRDGRPGSKWRCLLPDMDRTFGNTRDRSIMDELLNGDLLLRRLRTFPEFRNRLLQRAAAHSARTLSTTRVTSIIGRLGENAAPEIPRQADRWGSPSPSAYGGSLGRMEGFAAARGEGYLMELGNRFEKGNVVDLTLSVSGEGAFRMAGVDVEAQTLRAYPDTEFELEALPAPGFRFDHWTGIAGGALVSVSFAEATEIIAHFVPDSSTGLSGEIIADTTLTIADSPYVISEDLIVPEGVTLTINSGVALELGSRVNLRVMGTLIVAGTEADQVSFSGRHGEIWGGVSFEETTTLSTLTHLVVRGASRGVDPLKYPSAIAGLDSDLVMDFVDISPTRGPLFFRGGSMVLRDSLIEIPLTGDGLNVKGGAAETIRCTFTGNQSPDTDAIDYDGVVDGIIRDCRMYDFRGFNSDGIDIGEECVNCLIEGNVIYYNSDKGVSIGQGSSVILRRNLIVGCPIGVAVKDEGSTVVVDGNTIVDCAEGVAVYEKNFGNGGGDVIVMNTIFSGCDEPVTVDLYSTLEVSFSLSDTGVLPGGDNLLADPLFTDEASLNFELTAGSPAVDAGDPLHDADPDGSRVDIGAAYSFSRDDYPFDLTPAVVVNEVLANSGDSPDWIELHNRTTAMIDIGGWFLSDDRSNLSKYRIPLGTVLEAGGFVTFYEDAHFGNESLDPGRVEGFALSDTGETIYLSSALGDQLTYYRFEEDFGSSLEGRSMGFHEKSDGGFNFVTLAVPTPGAPNALPDVGPVVISEIMYHGEVEYLELLNISDEKVELFDLIKGRGWRIDRGIEFEFEMSASSNLAPNERAILTNDRVAFTDLYLPGNGLKIWQWSSGKLSNSGETLQLDRPGPLNDLGSATFVRVDRVKYDEELPWDTRADGLGFSLTRIAVTQYGNDFVNWQAVVPSPGKDGPSKDYEEWALIRGLVSPDGDEDGDGLSNIFEYAFGRNPLVAGDAELLAVIREGASSVISLPLDANRSDLVIVVEGSTFLETWYPVPTEISDGRRQATLPLVPHEFYRLRIIRGE